MKTKLFRKIVQTWRATSLLLLATAPAFAQTPHLPVCAGKGYTIQSAPEKDAAGTSPLTFTWYEKDHSSSGDYNQIGTTTASSYYVAAKNEQGTYSYVRMAANAECQGVPSNTYTIVVLAPAAPTITAPSNVCQNAGSLVFTINSYNPSGSTGSTYTWTKLSGTDGDVDGTTSSYTVSSNTAATTTVTAAASVTYRIPGLDAKVCVSGTATAQSAVVHPLPKVTQTGAGTWCGSGSHTLEVTAEVSGSSEGVSVAWYTDSNPGSTVSNSTSHTVPAATGPDGVQTYTYYVQATANACTGAAATVTGVRNLYEGALDGFTAPTHAVSDSIWTFGSSALVWSDRIAIPKCEHATFTNSTYTPSCRSYKYNETLPLRYYYNWPYVNTNAATLCPAPWRVPTKADFETLTNYSTLTSAWGLGGYADGSSMSGVGSTAYYWSSAGYNSSYAHTLVYNYSSLYVGTGLKNHEFQVRCVK